MDNKEYLICEKEELVAIADAVRNKTGSTESYVVSELPNAINGIEAGGSISDGIQLVKVNIICNDLGNYYMYAPIVDENGLLLETKRHVSNGDTFYTAVSKSSGFVNVEFYLEAINFGDMVDSFDVTADDGSNGSKVIFNEVWWNGVEDVFCTIHVRDDFASDTYEITLTLNGTLTDGWGW